jgi:ABC-type polysaccharide transport system permease subunit
MARIIAYIWFYKILEVLSIYGSEWINLDRFIAFFLFEKVKLLIDGSTRIDLSKYGSFWLRDRILSASLSEGEAEAQANHP